MDFEPGEPQAAIASMARSFAQDRVAPSARENDRKERFPEELVRELGDLGLLAVNVPEECGGSGAGAVSYVLSLMEIAAADCALAVTMAVTNMVGEIIARYGTEEQKRRHCPRLASGEYLAGAFALSEPQAGSDSAALATRAERRPRRRERRVAVRDSVRLLRQHRTLQNHRRPDFYRPLPIERA